MKKMMKKIWDSICTPFISVACIIDESKRINEDGSWDGYWAQKNKREERAK